MRLFNFFLGSVRLTFSCECAAEIMNICMRHSIAYKNVRDDTEHFVIEARLIEAKRLIKLCKEAGIEIKAKKLLGLPALIYRYRNRYGIFLGVILSIIMIIASQAFLWDVRIEGNEQIDEREIKKALADSGLAVGTPLKNIKPEKIEGLLLIDSDTISWVSVNMRGTVALVEIREHAYPTEKVKPEAANLIAECDGTIVGFEEVRGNILVSYGDLVREGELLVSGVYDSPTLGFNVTAASGSVFASVRENFKVNIPYEYEKKSYTGREYVEKYLIFYDKEIKFYSNCRNLPPKCDTIEVIDHLSFFEGEFLPFGVRTVRYLEYETQTAKMDADAAADEAFYTLRLMLDAAGATEPLHKSFTWEIGDTEYTLTCTVDYVKNIARQVEIPYIKK